MEQKQHTLHKSLHSNSYFCLRFGTTFPIQIIIYSVAFSFPPITKIVMELQKPAHKTTEKCFCLIIAHIKGWGEGKITYEKTIENLGKGKRLYSSHNGLLNCVFFQNLARKS